MLSIYSPPPPRMNKRENSEKKENYDNDCTRNPLANAVLRKLVIFSLFGVLVHVDKRQS